MLTVKVPGIEYLLDEAGEEQELEYKSNNDRLRINLRAEDIRLWQAHHAAHPGNANLLLACESSNGELTETRLTWVVGAAIRPAMVEGKNKAIDLLGTLGISKQLTELASTYIPGLGLSIIWAFHLERHGWLTATPVQSWTQEKVTNENFKQ